MDHAAQNTPVPSAIESSHSFVHNAGVHRVGTEGFDTKEYSQRRMFFKQQSSVQQDALEERAQLTMPSSSTQQVVLVAHTLDQHQCKDPNRTYKERREWYHHNRTTVGLPGSATVSALGTSSATTPCSAHNSTVALLLLIFCTVFGMCTWFSAGAVLPQLKVVYNITETEGSLLTLGVNFGFLIGALLSVVFALADRYPPSKLMSVGAAVAALFNIGMLLPNCGFGGALLLRVGTGCAMALVYPMACKVAASWFVENRGLAIGFVVGSVGLGSSSPHLVNVFFSQMPWENVLLVCSLLSGVASVTSGVFLTEGPHLRKGNQDKKTLVEKEVQENVGNAQPKGTNDPTKHPFVGLVDHEEKKTDNNDVRIEIELQHKNMGSIASIASVASTTTGTTTTTTTTDRALITQNSAFWWTTMGYCGHNWELYALWLWFKKFAYESDVGALLIPGDAKRGASLCAFFVIGSSMIGSVAAGLIADRIGRTTVCLGALFVSIVCSLFIGWSNGVGGPGLTFLIGIIWGICAVAESAQYSAMTSEVVNPRVVGNAVTIQFGIGFLMTMPGMFIVPSIVAGTNNWGLAWSTLTPGTVIAAFAMLMMRRNHIALRVAKERGRRFM